MAGYKSDTSNAWASVQVYPNSRLEIFANTAFNNGTASITDFDYDAGALTSRLFGILPLPLTAIMPFGGSILSIFLTMLLFVNVFWGIFNLLPVYPLDGGQVTRNALIQYDPRDGVRKSLWVSVIAGGVIALVGGFLMDSVYIALLFGVLAFQSYQSLQGRY